MPQECRDEKRFCQDREPNAPANSAFQIFIKANANQPEHGQRDGEGNGLP